VNHTVVPPSALRTDPVDPGCVDLFESSLLVLSPHFDDAALSCAALLARRRPVDVATVFAGTPTRPVQSTWDRQAGFRDSTDAMRARRQEEETAFAGSGHRLRALDLLDVSYLAGRRDAADERALQTFVTAWFDEEPSGVVAVPAGAGRRRGTAGIRARRALGLEPLAQHPDHLFVRDVVLHMLPPERIVVLYEEMPYCFGKGADDEASRVLGGRDVDSVVLPVDRVAKAQRIAAYRTQIGMLRGRIASAEHLPVGERYWIGRPK
jgi:LmbE family N-acetylglucosaminyl deacetylase